MGTKQSILTVADNTVSHDFGGGDGNNRKNNNDSNDDDQACCQGCWFPAHAPFKLPHVKANFSDHMGTPILTPLHERRKRGRIQEEMNSGCDHQEGLERENEGNGSHRWHYHGPGQLDSLTLLSAHPSESNPNSNRNDISTSNDNGAKCLIKHPPDDEPGVYEGKDAEKLLHAKYELLEVLGVGATSTVHRCSNRATFRDYACKVVDKRHLSENFYGMMDQFHTEIQALKSLRHDNIIQLFDVFISDDKIFIVMELMYGGELFDYVVEKGTLTEEEASAIVRKVTSAIVYMHSKNIIHRDLKPENLLLRHRPKTPMDLEVKIIDFGLSKCMIEPVTSSFLGTRGYLAPEMLQRLEYSKAVDAWALGVIVFVLLCGCLPFDDDSQAVATDALLQARFVLRFPRWAKNLSASAKDLLSKLLDVSPYTRYTARDALRHPWVTGETAPSDNVLESPGRIKMSPAVARKHRRTNSRDYNTVQHFQQGVTTVLVAPKRNLVRKTSI